MKKNLFVVSYDYSYCVKISKMLAQFFDLRFFDWRELFEFDNVPRTLEEVIRMNGAEDVREKLHSICRMQSEFDETVFSCDLAVAKNIDKVNKFIKDSNIVIYLKKDDIKAQMSVIQKYENGQIKAFFGDSVDTVEDWGKIISDTIADIVVDIDGLSTEQTMQQIADKLKMASEIGSGL